MDVIGQFEEEISELNNLDTYLTEIRGDMEQIGEAGDYSDTAESYAVGTKRGIDVDSDDTAY